MHFAFLNNALGSELRFGDILDVDAELYAGFVEVVDIRKSEFPFTAVFSTIQPIGKPELRFSHEFRANERYHRFQFAPGAGTLVRDEDDDEDW